MAREQSTVSMKDALLMQASGRFWSCDGRKGHDKQQSMQIVHRVHNTPNIKGAEVAGPVQPRDIDCYIPGPTEDDYAYLP